MKRNRKEEIKEGKECVRVLPSLVNRVVIEDARLSLVQSRGRVYRRSSCYKPSPSLWLSGINEAKLKSFFYRRKS